MATGNVIHDNATNDVLPSDDVSYQCIDEVEGTLNHLVAISIDSYARQILISSCMCQSFHYVTQPHIFM